MQDIIPSNHTQRGQIRPTRRSDSFEARTAGRVLYERDTKVITDVIVGNTITETIVEEIEKISYSEPGVVNQRIERLSAEAKNQALQRALVAANKSLRKERRKTYDLKRFGLVFIAVVFVLVTGYVSIDTWMTNNKVKAETAAGPLSAASEGGVTVSPDQEGKDEKAPSSATLSSYAVAPTLPRALYIDKIGVAARVLPMSVNSLGAIQAPLNIYDAGWYTGSVKPGEIGAVFIDGHASGPTREGLLANLDQLVEGDELQIEKGDGAKLTYKVVHTEIVPLDGLDMKKVLLPYGNTLKGLNLMTCTGTWVESKKTFDHRVIVYTEQIN